MVEKTLVLIKPDAVERQLTGEILKRFENVGLKIVGLKMLKVDRKFAMQHYTEDITKRHGQKIRDQNLDFLTMGPVIAVALEGIEAVDVVRKMIGSTEPKSAAPGTIRGDFTHVGYAFADKVQKVVRNVVHASGNKEEAASELSLWFSKNEILSYRSVHDKHILHE